MSNQTKDLGPCELDFDDSVLGKTFGGVRFRHTEESAPVREDQAGATEVDGITSGVSACEAEAPLTRITLANLAKTLGNAAYEDGVLGVKASVGKSRKDNAKKLILKPIIDDVVSADPSTWLTIHLASPRVDWDVEYSAEGQRVYRVVFKAYPDPDNDNELFKVGE